MASSVESPALDIRHEPADSPGVPELIAALDAHLTSVYPPESCFMLSVDELLQPNIIFIVAREGGRAIACGAVRYMDGYAEVKRMYVAPAHRGKGIARRILAKLEDEARAANYSTVRLETGVRQPEALRLYEGCGYTRRGPFGEYPEDGLSVFYEKGLF